MFALLHIAVVEEDGVVHGNAQLKNGGDGFGDVGDFPQNDIGAEVIDDGHADPGQKHQGQGKGLQRQQHHRQGQNHRQADKDGQFFVHDGTGIPNHHRKAGQEACFVAQGPNLINRVHGLVRSAGIVILDNHHGGAAREKDIPKGGRNHLGGNLDAHQVGQPQGVGHPRHLLDLVEQLVAVASRHTVHHQHTGGRHVEGVFQQFLPLG